MPEIKPSTRKKNPNPMFPLKLVEEIREKTGACNQSLLMKIAAKLFVEEHDINEIAEIVAERKEAIQIADMEKHLATLKAEQKGK